MKDGYYRLTKPEGYTVLLPDRSVKHYQNITSARVQLRKDKRTIPVGWLGLRNE